MLPSIACNLQIIEGALSSRIACSLRIIEGAPSSPLKPESDAGL